MKKILAVLLAILMMFSCTALIAFADEDNTVPEESTEPEVQVAYYEICQDEDFSNVTYLDKGNSAATLLKPGDIITTYKTSDLKIWYYADADAMYKGKWEPADTNNLAFSLSGTEVFKETFRARVTKEATIRGLDSEELPMDFTIAYPEENVFLGWVISEYESSSNTIKVCGVWEKNHKIPVSSETDDFYYIIDFFYTLRQKIAAPFFKVIKVVANAFLFVKTWLYNLVFGEKTAA